MKRVLGAIVAGLVATAAGPGGAREPTPAMTQDRMSSEQLAALVSGPMEAVESGDITGGEARLEALLMRRAKDRLKIADTLMAFGIGLYKRARFDDEGGDEGMKRALTFVERSVPVYREVFGPDHPELALALNTQADLLVELHPDGPLPEAEALMDEVMRIRTKSLTPGHVETLTSLSGLAKLKARSGAGGLMQADALFSQAVGGLIASSALRADDLLFLYEDWARMYADNGEPARAVEVVRRGAKVIAETAGAGADTELGVAMMVSGLAMALQEAGHDAEARALLADYPVEILADFPAD